mgnify:CR=1 FL=1
MNTRITSFKTACKALGIADTLPQVEGLPKEHQKAIIAHYKLVIIAQALNDGWKPDWDNNNEYKYYPYFDMEKGFSFCIYDDFYTHSSTGSRLCFKNRELAQYAILQNL